MLSSRAKLSASDSADGCGAPAIAPGTGALARRTADRPGAAAASGPSCRQQPRTAAVVTVNGNMRRIALPPQELDQEAEAEEVRGLPAHAARPSSVCSTARCGSTRV